MSEPPTKKSKKTDVSEEDIGDEEEMTEEMKAIDDIQGEISVIEEEEAEEVMKISLEYNKKKRPLLQKRQKAIEKVEGFWFTVISQHPYIGPLISQNDEEVFNSLNSVDVIFPDKDTYRVSLGFKENPYFSNSELWKEFKISGDTAEVTSCTIEWKDTEEAKSVQDRLVKKLMENDDGSPDATFFSVYDEDERDFEFGEAFKNDIFDHPLESYYSTDMLGEGDFEEGDEEEEAEEGES